MNALESSRKVWIEPDRSIPLASASVISVRGSLLDPPEKEGLSRVAFRLMRRTGAHRSGDVSDEILDGMGAHLSAEVQRSHAGFHGTTIARKIPSLLDFIEECLASPGFSEEEFRLLIEESQAELIERLDDDRALSSSFFGRALFRGHPYARPAGGTASTLASITVDDVRAQRERLLRRDDLLFSFSGPFEEAEALKAAEQLRAQLPSGSEPEPSLDHPSARPGRHLLFVDKPERSQTQILIGGLGSHPEDPDHIALHVGNTIFGGTFTARLSQEVRAKRGWSYGAYSSLPFDRKRQAFSLWTFPAASDARACIELELRLLEDWVRRGVTKAELGRAKKYLIRSSAFSRDTAAKRVQLRVEEELYGLPNGYHDSYLERVAAVTLDAVNQAIARRISLSDLLITIVGTHAAIGAEVQRAIPDLASTEVVAFNEPDFR